MSGLMFVNEDGRRWRLEARNVTVLTDAFGEAVLIGFCQCFAVADRLRSILDLMHLNYEGAGRDTLRGERNLQTLGAFACGLVFELRTSLLYLDSETDLRSKLSDVGLRRWEKVARYARLENHQRMSRVRNYLAFHPGDAPVVRRGIQRLASEGTSLVVIAGDGPRKVDGQHSFGTSVILAGLNVTDIDADGNETVRQLENDDLRLAYTEARDGHMVVLKRLEEVFLDALRTAGASLDELPPDDDDDEEDDEHDGAAANSGSS